MVEDFEKKFQREVAWLHENIPPEEIYVFAYQAFLSSEYFLWKWSQWVDLTEELEKSENSKLWLTNVCGIRMLMLKEEPIDN